MDKMQRFNRYHQNRIVAKNTTTNNNNNNNNNNNSEQVPIRKLYVAPIKRNITNRIKGYFEQFGEVEFVHFRLKNHFQFGFVQFKMADHAKAVLAKEWHRIEKCHVRVKPADLHHQPEFGKEILGPAVPDQGSASHILIALNDDCLREVFLYFDLIDLSNVAEVCVRFNQHAKTAFAKKYKDLNLNKEDFSKKITKVQANNMLRNFGELIHTLKVDVMALDSNTPFLSIANQYCTALKQLELKSFKNMGKMTKWSKLFGHLEKLQFSYCEFSRSVKDLHSICVELKTLGFNSCTMGCTMDLGKCIKRQFAKLEEAHLVESDFDEGSVDCFIKMNRKLTKLSIIKNSGWESAKPIRSIGQNLNHLLELELDEDIGYDADEKIIQSLAQLNKLKVLKLNFCALPVAPLIKCLVEKKVPIEHLKINNGDIDDSTINYVSQMQTIVKLELNDFDDVLTDKHLIQLAKGLPHLDDLHVDSSTAISTTGIKKMLTHAQKLSRLHLESIYDISINVDDYKDMLKTVKKRPEKVKLLIEIVSDGDKVNVDEHILADNRDILYINEDIEEDQDDDDMDSWMEWFDDYDDYDDDSWYGHDSDADSENGYGVGFMNGEWFFIG